MIYADKLLENRDLFFKSQCSLLLNHADEVYVYIINASFRAVQIRNDIDRLVIIFRKTRLDTLDEYK